MLESFGGPLVQKIETQRVLLGVDFLKKPIFEQHPFLVANYTFKDRVLYALSVIFTASGNSSESAAAGFVNSAYVVGYEDNHGVISARLSGPLLVVDMATLR
jgi:hypothetical protein